MLALINLVLHCCQVNVSRECKLVMILLAGKLSGPADKLAESLSMVFCGEFQV